MAAERHWAAIFSAGALTALPDPHPASAMATIAGVRYCASILPWRTCGAGAPWVGANVAERTEAATRAVTESVPDVWGGDWNHAMTGREWAGSGGGRGHIADAPETLGLSVLTKDLPHRIDGLFTIDHLAVPTSWRVRTAQRYVASSEGRRISDHDAYVVEAGPPCSPNRAQSG